MVGSGWNHDTLMAMAETDFMFWLDWQIEYDRAKAEASRKAAQKGK